MYLQSDHNKWEDIEDERLWMMFKSGSREALSELFLRYYQRLFSYGMKLFFDEEAVKDGIQQLFLRLWKKKEVLDEAHSVDFYLLLSLRRILLRQKQCAASLYKRNQDYTSDFVQTVTSVEERIIKKEMEYERHVLYKQVFHTLTDRQKEVLVLRMQHGLTNEEIAEVMELSHQRVRNLIYESVKRLRRQISESMPQS